MIAGNMNELPLAGVAPAAPTTSAKAGADASSRSGGGFDEALSGASSVLDRQARSNTPARDRSQGADHASETASARANERAAAAEGEDETAAADAPHDVQPVDDAAGDDEGAATAEAEAAATTATNEAAATQDAAASTTTTTNVQAPTVAVSAAPVVETSQDAVLQPTLPQATSASTDAVDAAIRLAIGGVDVEATDAEAATVTTDATSKLAAVASTDGGDGTESETGQLVQLARNARGAEGAKDGDADVSAKSSLKIDTATASGPSLVQQETTDDAATATTAAAARPVDKAAVAVATAATAEVADGETVQTAQQTAAVVETSDDASDLDADAARIRAAVLQGAKVDDKSAVVAEETPEDVDGPAVNVVRSSTTANAAAQSANAQQQRGAAEAGKVAEAAVDEAAPAVAKGDGAAQQPLQAQRTEQTTFGQRVRELTHANGMRERIDHIAEQLATRLRLSHAAGGSQVQLSLRPRELGEVTVQMNVREGVVAATVLVDRRDTLMLMQSNLDDLKKSLEQQGLQIQQFDVDVRDGADAQTTGSDARQGRSDHARTPDGSSLAGAAGAIPGLTSDREVTVEDHHDGDVSLLA